ncbi:hypothetical protein C0V75_16405 [Tabrizicola sp. TH137]|uniref:Hint domain-containing protein n=1 Tax=Tabrizicola sp. TH137 TaxID=2067452 RepID=UPI000CB3BD6D|nr:Hint domain-containing protein [Tabrizicola sp. TH137]PLL11597.1 hypothetical protein C0V75_16405 [Tabrizicola sp. TH137]
MPVFNLTGFSPSSVIVNGGGPLQAGSSVMLDPSFSTATDRLNFSVTDDDDVFSGGTGAQQDSNQTAVVTNAAGQTVANGLVRVGNAYTLNTGDREFMVYEVYVGQTLVGYVSDLDLQPGISATVTSVQSATAAEPRYGDIREQTYNPAGDNDVDGGTGNDNVQSGAGNDRVRGDGGNDTIDGGSGNDRIEGDAGNDVLTGGTGADLIYGGDGNDRVILAMQDGADTLYGGNGTDTLDGSGLTGNVTLTFNGTGSGTMTGAAGSDEFYEFERFVLGSGNDSVFGGSGADSVDAGAGNDSLSGAGGADTLAGGAGNDTLRGGTGNDQLWGGDGDDLFVIVSGDGSDTITGGSGNDTLDMSGFTTGVTLNASGEGAGTASGGGGTTSYSQVETVVTGSAGDSLTGGSGNDIFDTRAGADTIFAGAGNDRLFGGDGTDSLDAGAGDDWVEGGNDGDTVFGGIGNDSVYGGAGADSLDAGAGNDLVDAGTENDTVFGGTGNDSIFGGAGTDSLDAGDGDDLVQAGIGDDILFGGIGTDQLFGGDGNDSVDGGDGNDLLDAGAGNDTLFGGAGDDTVRGGAGSDTMVGGSGTDRLDYSDATAGVSVNLETNATGGGAAGDSISGFEDLQGSALNDTLTGNGDNNRLWGGAGEDRLFGGAGNDSLSGGDGNDSLDGGAGNDTLAGGAGADTLRGSTGMDVADYSASDAAININLSTWSASGGHAQGDVLSGIDGIIGSAFNDTITGFDNFGTESSDWFINTLYGGAGEDLIDGLAGNDILSGGADNDTVFAGLGDDTVDGDEGNDRLFGGAGNDTIRGGTGNDSITGGEGADTLSGGEGRDVFFLTTGGGSDAITDFDVTLVDGLFADQLDVSGLVDEQGNPVRLRDVTVTSDGAGGSILSFPGGVSIRLAGVDAAVFQSRPALAQIGIPCFGTGTLILTERGEVPVEMIRAGDLVMTLDHGLQPVIWAGGRHLDRAALAAEPLLRPVLIRDGALGNRGDVLVSPNHAVLAEVDGQEMLVRAKHLAETGDARFRIAKGRREVKYHHLLLERHGIVFAQGMATETMYPGPIAVAALGAEVAAEIAAAFPLLAPVLAGVVAAEWLYGPTARPVAKRRMIFCATPARQRAAA